jgi:hypothetical protein
VHRNACLPEDGHQLAFAREHRGLHVEGLSVGVGQQSEEMVFGTAALERGDELEHPNGPSRNRYVGLLGEDSLHAALL